MCVRWRHFHLLVMRSPGPEEKPLTGLANGKESRDSVCGRVAVAACSCNRLHPASGRSRPARRDVTGWETTCFDSAARASRPRTVPRRHSNDYDPSYSDSFMKRLCQVTRFVEAGLVFVDRPPVSAHSPLTQQERWARERVTHRQPRRQAFVPHPAVARWLTLLCAL